MRSITDLNDSDSSAGPEELKKNISSVSFNRDCLSSWQDAARMIV